MTTGRWLDQIVTANAAFKEEVQVEQLPVTRTPGPAVITCMDPRVNLNAIGIANFANNGAGRSSVRIIRTLGAMAENRSLLVGIFLAGIKEIVVLMHTDCGCCLAYSKVDTLIENMENRLSSEQVAQFKAEITEPLADNLRSYLKAFQDPHEAVVHEVNAIHALPFMPDDVVVHGLVYELTTGKIDVVVNGYERPN